MYSPSVNWNADSDLEGRVKWINIAAMPILITASGLSLAFLKRKRTSAK
jgi:hypothetical protein